MVQLGKMRISSFKHRNEISVTDKRFMSRYFTILQIYANISDFRHWVEEKMRQVQMIRMKKCLVVLCMNTSFQN